jgi:hypothetical protein
MGSYVAPEAKPNQDDLRSRTRSQVYILGATHYNNYSI